MDERRLLPVPVLAEGEATGHAHRLPEGIAVLENPDGTREFTGPATVTHEEHAPVALPPTEYLSDRVREYDHAAEEARRVCD